jgi:hypothetical protein
MEALNFGDRVRLDDKLMLVPASFRDEVPIAPYASIPGGVTGATAIGHCQMGNKSFGSEHELPLRTEWSIAELLPLEFWKPAHMPDQTEVTATCELQIRLTNQYGSTRLRHVNKALITGTLTPTAGWIKSTDLQLPPLVDYYKADLFKVPASENTTVIACSSFAHEYLAMPELRLNNMITTDVQSFPLQSCRILQTNPSGVVVSSSAFKIKYPSRDLQSELYVRLEDSEGNILYNVENGLQYKVTNPEPFPIQVRIRKDSLFYISYFGQIAPWSQAFGRSKNQEATFHLGKNNIKLDFETGEHAYFYLQPGEAVEFSYNFSLHHRTGCGVREVFGGFDFLIPPPSEIPLIERANQPVTAATVQEFESSFAAYPIAANAKPAGAGRLPYFIKWKGSPYSPSENIENIATDVDLACWTFD